MKKVLVLLILLFNSVLIYSQSEVKLDFQLLTSDLIAEVTLERDPFFKWIKNIKSELNGQLQKIKGNKNYAIVITLHPDSEATVSISTKPQPEKKEIEKLLQIFQRNKAPHTKISDYSFAIFAKVNKGCKKDVDYSPALLLPLDRKIAAFEKLSLAEKKKSLQKWIRKEVLPILTWYEISVDQKFEGVYNMGKVLKQKKYLKTKVEDLTDKNPDYWRAIMEMGVGNQLLLFTKACLYIEKGEFDKANRLLFVMSIFSKAETLAEVFYEEISIKLKMIRKELADEINIGIALHDKGKYKSAIKHYKKLLKIFPYSAWLNYEIYYSKVAGLDSEKLQKEWEKAKEVIFTCDPLYHMNVIIKSGREAYLFFRRQEVNELFHSNKNFETDFIKYADIAFDLEYYGFAAQLYWLIFSSFPEEAYEGKNILAYYLYCLDKLGYKDSLKIFEGDFKSEFPKIEKEREKIMKESSAFKAFKNK